MLHKAGRTPARWDRGKFVAYLNAPGLALPGHKDHGYGPLALIAESFLEPGTLIAMHEHVQDEIISWVPRSVMRHRDKMDGSFNVDCEHLLVMNAGLSVWHEERTLESDPPLRMLQIIVRPHTMDLAPIIQFGPLPAAVDNAWRQLAGPEDGTAPFTLRNRIAFFDLRLRRGASVTLPERRGWATYLYIFEGEVEAGGMRFTQAESALDPEGHAHKLTAIEDTMAIAFLIDPDAPLTYGGTVGDVPFGGGNRR